MSSEFLFPHEKIRKIQDDLVKDIADAVKNRKHMIAHAPTGLGKTAAVLGPSLKRAIDENLSVLFLTSRHTQHMIAVETLKEIRNRHNIDFNAVDIIGKKWMCAMPGVELLYSSDFSEYCKAVREDGKCEFYINTKNNSKATVQARKILDDIKKMGCMHTEKLIELAKQEKVCPYEVASMLASESKVVIADYSYVFNPGISETFFAKAKKELDRCIVIIDEGHNLPNRIRDSATEKLSSFTIKKAMKEAKKHGYDEIVSALSQIQDILNDYSKGMKSYSERLVNKDDFMKKIAGIKDYDELIADLEFTGDAIREEQKKSSVGAVSRFLDKWRGYDDGFARIFSVREFKMQPFLTLSYRCLDPSVVSKEIISGSYSTILMSGTLNPTEMYRDLLGFPKDTVERSYESPFKEENKLTLVVPETTTKFSMRHDEQFMRIAEICADIVNMVPGNSAIFFPSYAIRDRVYAYLDSRCKKTTMLEHQRLTKEEKAEVLEKFKSYSKSGAVLLGVATGSFGEGIDLPGDLLKCVVVVGLPLQQPDLETKELITYYDKKFGKGWDYGYIFPAFNKCLQNAGRCIRSETDRGVVIFLDQRYIWPMYKRCFPEDSDIKVTTHYKEMIDEFFEPMQRKLG
ncbi:hypothetical protein COV19_02615 [Candidatus Woesearchaeota archaeon CG10_big_fil_rev_8_21_14_0_10_44_13]|nr:MAG: hypothetical protein COV19_02615 [Candidatus Woesearchaeota archaeon CG10_big_fil_rev_8_21_14_0_10_44_13]